MTLNSFSIKKLFGVYTYEFILLETQNLFMITGPNGYGKTTILTIINNLSLGDLFYFYQLDFEEIKLGLDNNQSLLIKSEQKEDLEEQSDTDKKNILERQVDFFWSREDKIVSHFSLNKKVLQKATRNIGYYKGIHHNLYDLMSDDFYAFIKDNIRIYELLAKDQGQEQFLMLLKSIPSTFIKAQRVFVSNGEFDKQQSSSIDVIVKKLEGRIHENYIEYLRKSQQKDSAFIDILLKSETVYSASEYDEKVKILKPKVEELCLFNLINVSKIRPFDSNNAKILSAYIDELDDKIEVYSKMLKKLRLFSSLLKNKKFSHKSVSFSPEYGLRIETDMNKFLNVNKLSSGEQNEIIMLYNFIFEVPDKAILLIDEPENSLHVAWQQEFINDIEEISKLKEIQLIIATHSPQIIAERWDECFDLYEKNLAE